MLLALMLPALLPFASAHAEQAATEPDAGPDLYTRTQAQPNLLAKYLFLDDIVANSEDPAEVNRASQSLAFAAAAIGEHRRAQEAFPFKRRHDDPSTVDPADYQAIDAVEPIVRASADHRLVMVNEAHHVARTRLLTLHLLQPLRKAGFTHLALETLGKSDVALGERGYAIATSGYYSKEPVFAELIREALRLGYAVVPYEHTGDEEGHQARETGQARNLAHLLEQAPDARVLVHAGYAHIFRNEPASMFGARTMVEELERMTGLHALTVEQTLLHGHIDPQYDRPEYTAALSHWLTTHDGNVPARPFVLTRTGQSPWSMRPEVFDISVFGVPPGPDQGWRSLDGRSERRMVNVVGCGGNFPCLIEARRANEPDIAVPADRELLHESRLAELWLAEGCYRLDTINATGSARGNRYCTDTTTAEASR